MNNYEDMPEICNDTCSSARAEESIAIGEIDPSRQKWMIFNFLQKLIFFANFFADKLTMYEVILPSGHSPNKIC